MSTTNEAIQGLLNDLDDLLIARNGLKPVELAMSTQVIANYARILLNQIVELRDNISFQPKYLKQAVKSRKTMETYGLDTNKMDNVVAMLLGKLKIKTAKGGDNGMGSVSDIPNTYGHLLTFSSKLFTGKIESVADI